MAVYDGPKPAALVSFGFVFAREIAWGDMDAMRHVNNTRYLHFCESARIEFLRTEPGWNDSRVPDEEHAIGLALAEVNCQYKAPVVYPDTLLIGLATQVISENSFAIQHSMYSCQLERIAAVSVARMVHYNFKTRQREPLSAAQNQFLAQFAAPE